MTPNYALARSVTAISERVKRPAQRGRLGVSLRYLCVGVALLSLSGCDSSKSFEVCDMATDRCQRFESEEQYAAWDAQQRDQALQTARALSVDYRDLSFVLLKEELGQPDIEGYRYKYFVSLFGDDIDAILRARLDSVGIHVDPGSEYLEGSSQEAAGSETVTYRNRHFAIYAIEDVGGGTFRIRHGYNCGSDCAGGFESYLRNEAGQWKVVRTQLNWIS